MLTSNTNVTPNLLKYYVFATISFLVAVSFHSSVYHRFGLFEKNLNEAARIKMMMEWDELKAFNYYLKSVRLHRRGIQDTIEAYEYAYSAVSLNETVQEEEKDVERLKEEASKLEQQADFDKRMSAMDGMSSFRNNRSYVGSKIVGMNLAKLAEEENERSEVLMNQTSKDEALGKEKLREAQEALLRAEMAQNSTGLDRGICYWASAICNVIRSDKSNEGRSSTAPVEPSDAVIKANGDIQIALKMIHEAEDERSLAIGLHRKASLHANLSTELLKDAEAFRNESKIDLELAKEYQKKVEEEEAAAMNDLQLAQKEEVDIALKEAEIRNDTEHSAYMFRKVASDRYEEAYAIKRMNRDLEFVEKRRAEWEEKMEEAKIHVSKAGWEALVASVSGLCLLILVGTRIIATFRYQRPMRWILREPPFFSQDLWYLICHLSIFVLAMGYVGELLMTFHNQTNISKAGITVVFALSAAFLQVTLVHFIPAVDQLARESHLDSSEVLELVKTLFVKKGTIIALVSAIEMLLCWCWMGTLAFTQVHKLNNFIIWFAVLCESVGYWVFLRTCEHSSAYVPTTCSSVPRVSSELPSSIVINDERNSLLGPSFSESSPGYIPAIQSPKVSSESSPSLQSVPFGDSECRDDNNYGSLSRFFRSYLSTSPLSFSWNRDLIKVRLLFEFWLASLAWWIIRRDLELIRKLSPLSADLVWGMVPLWILNISFFLVMATVIVSVANVKQRQW